MYVDKPAEYAVLPTYASSVRYASHILKTIMWGTQAVE